MSGWCKYPTARDKEASFRCNKPKEETKTDSDDTDSTMKEQVKPEPSPCWGQVLYDFKPQEDTEIAVRQGEKVTIHNEVRGWLFVETKEGHYGYIPLKFCTVNGTAPRRDPLELKVRLSKQGHRINDVDGGLCFNDNRVEVKSRLEKCFKSINADKGQNDNDGKSWCKEHLDNALSTNASLKHAIATPLLVAYARKTTIKKDYCMDGEQISNSGKTNRETQLMDTMCLQIPDVGSEHSETSETSLSSLEETSSVNSQPDSVRSDDAMDSTPEAFLPVMMTKIPDLLLPDDSTTDSGFSMDEDNEFSESERYKQILKRKAVDVIYKQNLIDARKTPAFRMPTCNGSKMQKQTVDNETTYDVSRIPNLKSSGANISEFVKSRPLVPPKTIPFDQRISVQRQEDPSSKQLPEASSDGSNSSETKGIPRVSVVTKPTNTDSRPQGSTFLSRFAVRRSSKENTLGKGSGKTAPAVARKQDPRCKLGSSTLPRSAARGHPRSKDNLLETEAKPGNVAISSGPQLSAHSGNFESQSSHKSSSGVGDDAGKLTVKAEVHTANDAPSDRVSDLGRNVKSCLRVRGSSTRCHSVNLTGRKWGSMECLLDTKSWDNSDAALSKRSDQKRTGSVECLLDSSTDMCADDGTQNSDMRFRKPSIPPDLLTSLQGKQKTNIGNNERCKERVKEIESKSQYVSIQTSKQETGLCRSSQVLHTFRTWLDTDDEPEKRCQSSCGVVNSESSVNQNEIGAKSGVSSNIDNRTEEPMSTSGQDGSWTIDSPSASSGANVVVADVSKSAGKISASSLKVLDHTGAVKTSEVPTFESPSLQQLDEKTSAYLNSDFPTASSCCETSDVRTSTINLTTKGKKNKDSRIKLRRVQSLKETSTAKVDKRRVDWGPCVQIHIYDPETEINSDEDHVCRTTAMDFANTLEYEGSLV